jgi:tetratricopeptide (TPR) repeat protein
VQRAAGELPLKVHRAQAALVALTAVAVHARTLWFGLTGLDDRDLVVGDHAFLADPSNLLHVFGRSYLHVVDAAHAYWRPVVTASYVLDAQWSGVRPPGFHATNVLLHAVTSVLVLALLRRFRLGSTVSLLGALAFAVHPALADAVAWIPGRNDELVAAFGLGAWLALRRRRPALHLGLFALALMAKETAVVLPLVWTVEAMGAARPAARTLRRRAWLIGAWSLLVAGRIAVHPAAPHATMSELLANLPLYPAALGQLALPVHPTVLAVLEDVAWWPGVLVAALFVVVTWRAPRARGRVVAFGGFVFAATLAPVLLVPGTLVLDCRLYLPAVGVLLAAGELAKAASTEPRMIRAFGAVGVGALALVTLLFEGAFHDEMAFAREAVAGSPRSPLAHVCLGQARQRARDDDGALAEYRAALALGPAEVAHHDVAVIEMRRAEWPEAERELRQELVVNPGFATAYLNLAIVLRREGRPLESCRAATQAMALAGTADPAMDVERRRDCDD